MGKKVYFDQPKHPHIVLKYEKSFKASFSSFQNELSTKLLKKLKSYNEVNKNTNK